jgi:GNAT acetyltransferase-like protein
MTDDRAPVAGQTPYANSVFQQPWWLDAVAPGRWGDATVCRDDTVVARLPYAIVGPTGLTTLGHPPLTPRLGPWIEPGKGKYESALTHEMRLMAALIEELPTGSSFDQFFSPTVTDGLPFHWAGYDLSVRYTYRLHEIRDEQSVWDGVSSKMRAQIRKARRVLTVRTDLGIDRFFGVWSQTFARQGMRVPVTQAFLERIKDACATRDAREILFAEDERGRVHSVAYVVWDRDTACYLLGGADPSLRTSDASSLLAWEAIRRSARVTDVFDFEGSMIRPVERFFRAFGARQVPYLEGTRMSRRVRVARALRGTVRRAYPGRGR